MKKTIVPSKLLILVDSSKSMNIMDEFGNQTRWASANRILSVPSVTDALKNLTQDNKDRRDLLPGSGHVTPWIQRRGRPASGPISAPGCIELWRMHGRDDNLAAC